LRVVLFVVNAGITRPGEASLKVYTSAEKIEFLSSSPSSFKPGFSYTGVVCILCYRIFIILSFYHTV